ncbi:putative choloylglycine hydrolase [Geomicrobium halophilum]|uniref:Putative choloylglycine hydrolase n=1 Tax=Geomicrobium halophilum TaxID=549000 RepID=A0A841Q0W0_9BACL|nr:C45 family peptidase [Geomicrobium halophilum]MBB6451065.1 putative choloylglycine hydrolase [Geomicrobium halophilum]
MKHIYSNIIQFRGNHYDFGYMQGKKLKDSLMVKNRENQWKVRKPRFIIDAAEVKQAILPFAPGVWDELLGLQDALEWPIERVLQEFGGYRLNINRSGCSILAGENYFIRNYDYHPKTYDGRYLLYQPTDQGYAMIGPSQRITGRMDGMNEKGLVMGYNLTNRRKPGDGFICSMIGRLILESCANVTEAVEMVREIPHRHSFSYAVYDSVDEMVVIESSPRGVEARAATACTNHFERLKQENRFNLDDSMLRLALMEASDAGNAYDAFRLLNDTDNDIFSTKYKSWAGTIHTSAYIPSEMKAWIGLGGDQDPIEFDFTKWLEGEDVDKDRITGEVDTDLPFVHMDEKADWFQRR